MDIEQTIDVAAPPERVWRVMSDVGRWPRWTASVTSVQRLDSGPFAGGGRARLPPAVWTVTAPEPGRSFTWRDPSPGGTSPASRSRSAGAARSRRCSA